MGRISPKFGTTALHTFISKKNHLCIPSLCDFQVLHHFTTGLREEIKVDGLLPAGIKNVGHGGADFYLVKNFILALARGKHEELTKGLNSALESHKLVFAAEKSRRSNGQTLELNVSS